MSEVEGRLLDAMQRLGKARQDALSGAPDVQSLLAIMAVVHDLHAFVVEQTAKLIRKDPRS